MAEHSKNCPSSVPQRGTRRRRWQIVASSLFALVAFQLFSCRSTESTWEAYQWPDTSQESVIRAAANEGGGVKDGSCAKCHQGCSDPHPGGRQATCVHCHGGDPERDRDRPPPPAH